jgi:hypothetical protein
MSRKPRISSLAEADVAMERLGWLRSMGQPNGPVRELFEVAAFYRAQVHRQQNGEQKRPGFVERVMK